MKPRPVQSLVLVVALFVVAVAAVMAVMQFVQPREEPWRSPALAAAKQRLEKEPRNEALKQEIRELDVRLRRAYFLGLERSRSGTWLLVIAGVALVFAARELPRRPSLAPPLAKGPGPAADREVVAQRTRLTVVAAASICALTFAGLGLTTRSHLPRQLGPGGDIVAGLASAARSNGLPVAIPGAVGGAAAPPQAWPSRDVLARNWPRFRGHDGGAVAGGTNVPLTWDVDSGHGVVWKTAVPLPGYNSPILWEDSVFLTGGDKKSRLVYCFDAATGAVRWQRPVTPTNAPAAATEVPDQSGMAASSAATDGERVFAIFASGELGALDFTGNLVWSKRLDFSDNGYGHASSLVVWQDRLLVQADQGQAEDGKSVLLALDTRTGKPQWTAKRPVGGSWTTPIVVEAGSQPPVLITASDPWLMAHDLATGAERWRAKVLGGELAPSPVFAGGLILATSPGHALSAVKAEGAGDVTESHVAWKLDREVPDVPTPVVAGDLLFTANTEGHLICRELASGNKLWEQALELEFQASPLLAGDRLYLLAQPGDIVVVEAGRAFRELARFSMNDEIYASPAAAGDRLFIRTKKYIYCLGETAGPAKVADAR